MEHEYPDLLQHLSTCKSPQSMFSPIARHYFAEKVLNKKYDLIDTNCTFCGQCISVCPTGALVEKDNTREAWTALAQKEKPVIVKLTKLINKPP